MTRKLLASATVILGIALAGCAAPAPSPTTSESSGTGGGGVSSSQACAAATLTVTPDRAAPGDTVEVAGTGYTVCDDAPDATSGAETVTSVRLVWTQGDDETPLGEVEIGEDGELAGSFTVPGDATAGEGTVSAGDGEHVSSEPASFTVD